MAEVDSVKYPSLPPNYVTIVHLKERWLKEKQRKQQEKENEENEENEGKKYPVPQNHRNCIANGSIHTEAPVGKNQENEGKKQYPLPHNHQNRIANESIHSQAPVGKNHSVKGWREVGLIAKEPKLKEVKITGPVVEEGVDGTRGKKKTTMGYFRKRKPRVERDGSGYMAEEEMMAVVSVENGGIESYKGKCKWNSENEEVEEVATFCKAEVVGESNVDTEIGGQRCRVGFRGKKHSWRKMGDRVGEVSDKVDSVERSGQGRNAEKEKVSVDEKERTNEKLKVSGAFRAYGDKEVEEVATICTVEVLGESNVHRVIGGKKNSWRKMGDRVGKVTDEDNAEQSGQKHNAEKEEVSLDVKERTNEKVRMGGAFRAYGDKEVTSVCTVEVVGESNVDREFAGQKCGVGFRGKKDSGRKLGDRIGEVSDTADRAEQSGQERNAEKGKVLIDVKERTDEKVRMGGAFRAYGDKEVASVCTVEVVGENNVDKEIAGQKCVVGFRGKKSIWRRMGNGVGQVSDKVDRGAQSGQEPDAEKEKVSLDMKERTNEKVIMGGTFRAYGDKEVDSVCTVEVVGENNVDKEIAGQKCVVGFRGKKSIWRRMGDWVGQVSDKVDRGAQSGQERYAEKEKVLIDVKEKTDDKVAASVCTVEVVGENNVDKEIALLKCVVGFRGKKNIWRRVGDRVGEVSNTADRVEQSGQERNAEKEKVLIDVKERTDEKVRMGGAFRAYGEKEVASVCTVEVVGENNVDKEIAGQKCVVGFMGKKSIWRRMGDGVGEVSNKVDRGAQSGQEHDAEQEKVSVDVKERTNEQVRMRGAFSPYDYKEVASVCMVEVVRESNVDREFAGQKCGVGFRGKKDSGRKMGDQVGEVSDKADRAEQSGQERNAEKEKVSVDVKERTNEKVKVSGEFRALGDKEVEEVATVCTLEVEEENKVDREITGQKCRVGFKGKKNSWRRMGDGVGQVSHKMDNGEQSGKHHNAEEEVVSVDVKERTDEKVKVSAAFRAYSDKEVEEVVTVCMVEVVEENKVDREITGQKHRVGFRGKKHIWRKIGDRVGEVSDKADSAEQSGQECNAEKEKVSVDVKERTIEKVRVRGAFCAYSDKSKDVLIDSEVGLMTIERYLGDLSLTDRRYGHGRSSVRVYGDKWRYGSSRRYEPRKMLKQRDNSFAWIKKGESSNVNVAEIETQVDFPAKAQVEVSCALSESS